MNPYTVTLTCHSCKAPLRITLGCPGEIEDVEEVWPDGVLGSAPDHCHHGWNDGDYTHAFYLQVCDAEQDAYEAAYDREMDARLERERDRVHDWERYPKEGV